MGRRTSGRLPSLSQREVIAALAGAGFRHVPGRGKGGHAFLHREDPPTGLTVPSGTVKRGTLRAIVRRAGLTVEQFLDLL